jgi:hypothetical protein
MLNIMALTINTTVSQYARGLISPEPLHTDVVKRSGFTSATALPSLPSHMKYVDIDKPRKSPSSRDRNRNKASSSSKREHAIRLYRHSRLNPKVELEEEDDDDNELPDAALQRWSSYSERPTRNLN